MKQGALISLASVPVLAVSFLLFLQWPLRDLMHAYAREANDLAPWVFALYIISVAATYAPAPVPIWRRTRSHIAIPSASAPACGGRLPCW